MKRFAVAFALLVFSCAGIIVADEKALKELEGTYKMTFAEKGGKVAPKEVTDSSVVTIMGDDFVLTFGPDDKNSAKIKVNPEAKPASIDIMPTDGDLKGKTLLGIYKIDKGEVTMAFAEKGERPKDFKADDEVTLIKLKKVEKK